MLSQREHQHDLLSTAFQFHPEPVEPTESQIDEFINLIPFPSSFEEAKEIANRFGLSKDNYIDEQFIDDLQIVHDIDVKSIARDIVYQEIFRLWMKMKEKDYYISN